MQRPSPTRHDTDTAHQVGARLKELRLDVGLTQAALARAVGRSRSLIAEYEADRKCIPHPMVWDLTRVLQVRVDALFEHLYERLRN